MHEMRRWLTGREAEHLLASVGVSRALAQLALRDGLAGPGHRRGSAALYDREAVRVLAARPCLPWAEVHQHVDEHHAGGLLVLRGSAADTWDLGAYLPPLLRVYRGLDWPMGVVATTGGFVTGAFELEGTWVDPGDRSRRRLRLAPAGSWAQGLVDTRLELGRGRPWHFLPGPWARAQR